MLHAPDTPQIPSNVKDRKGKWYSDDDSCQAYWADYFGIIERLKSSLREWKHLKAPTPSEKIRQTKELKELSENLSLFKKFEALLVEGHWQTIRKRRASLRPISPSTDLIGIDEACSLLNVTREELALFIFFGPRGGEGLRAFHISRRGAIKPCRLEPEDGNDYLDKLDLYLFARYEIKAFTPRDRYFNGRQLLTLFGVHLGDQAESYIKRKIRNYELFDQHPTQANTIVSSPEHEDHPPLEEGLFAMTEIVSLLEHELRVRYPLPKTGPESPDARRTRLRKTYDEHVKRLGREYGALAATVKDERDRTGRPISHQRVRQIIGLNEK